MNGDLLLFDGAPEPLHKNSVQGSPFAIHADLDLSGLQQLALLWTGTMAALIALADQRHRLSQCALRGRKHTRHFQHLISLPADDVARVPVQDRHQLHPARVKTNGSHSDPPTMIGRGTGDVP